MNESPNKRAVIVGIFIFLGIVFLVAGILAIGNLKNTFTKKIHVTAIFNDVNGLQKGNNIWFSGVKVGTVKTVRFYGADHVKVILNIDESARMFIRKDAKAKISTDGLIGNKIIVIQGGSFLTEAVSEGDTIGVEKIVSSEDMMNTLHENSRNLLEITKDFKEISGKIAGGKGSIGRILNDDGIYRDIAAASSSMRSAGEKANSLISSLSTFGANLNRKGTLAHGLVNDTNLYANFRASLQRLNRTADSASALVNNLKQASQNPKTPAGVLLHDEEAGAHLKSLLKNLDAGSKKLDEDLEAMQHSFLLRKYFRKKDKEKK
jgi:phospholipid/cholesterol/gamma-HCH transport system substrate-binding protein